VKQEYQNPQIIRVAAMRKAMGIMRRETLSTPISGVGTSTLLKFPAIMKYPGIATMQENNIKTDTRQAERKTGDSNAMNREVRSRKYQKQSHQNCN